MAKHILQEHAFKYKWYFKENMPNHLATLLKRKPFINTLPKTTVGSNYD